MELSGDLMDAYVTRGKAIWMSNLTAGWATVRLLLHKQTAYEGIDMETMALARTDGIAYLFTMLLCLWLHSKEPYTDLEYIHMRRSRFFNCASRLL